MITIKFDNPITYEIDTNYGAPTNVIYEEQKDCTSRSFITDPDFEFATCAVCGCGFFNLEHRYENEIRKFMLEKAREILKKKGYDVD